VPAALYGAVGEEEREGRSERIREEEVWLSWET